MNTETSAFDLIWEAEQDEPPSLELAAYIPQLLKSLHLKDAEFAILVTNDAGIQAYNRDYRGLDKPTDVLSFPAMKYQGSGTRHLGDIVISMDRTLQQAQEIGHSAEKEFRFLILHGLLHLLGYDHEVDDGEMFARQAELKQQLAEYF